MEDNLTDIDLPIIIISCVLFYLGLYRLFVVPAKKFEKEWKTRKQSRVEIENE